MSDIEKLPEMVAAAFTKLGEDQRGEAEMLMVNAQHVMGGGVYCFLIEHVGDLTHRMTTLSRFGGTGWDMVFEKVKKLLVTLRNPYGTEQEMMENFATNARYRGITIDDFMATLIPIMRAYTKAHRSLIVYNRCQWLAREAAVAVGVTDFASCEKLLTELEAMVATPETFRKAAFEYTIGPNGKLVEYNPGLTITRTD